jgi:hypothetical protein
MMKKKKYISPKIIVIAPETEHYLLAASGSNGKAIEAIGDFEYGDGDSHGGTASTRLFQQYYASTDKKIAYSGRP